MSQISQMSNHSRMSRNNTNSSGNNRQFSTTNFQTVAERLGSRKYSKSCNAQEDGWKFPDAEIEKDQISDETAIFLRKRQLSFSPNSFSQKSASQANSNLENTVVNVTKRRANVLVKMFYDFNCAGEIFQVSVRKLLHHPTTAAVSR